jgi:AcrR family transcriptional regulator
MPDRSPLPRRAYRSPRRREQAADTRRRVLDAAARLLAEHGYAGTTIAAVAREAGVSGETVYAAFGNKRTLVGELVRVSVRGAGDAPAAEQAGARAVAAAPDQAERLRLFAADVAERLERVGPVLQALAAASEPELEELRAAVDRDRLAGMRVFAVMLVRGGELRVGADAAAETVWALASPELYHALTARRGWTRERYATWLADTLGAALIPGWERPADTGLYG